MNTFILVILLLYTSRKNFASILLKLAFSSVKPIITPTAIYGLKSGKQSFTAKIS